MKIKMQNIFSFHATTHIKLNQSGLSIHSTLIASYKNSNTHDNDDDLTHLHANYIEHWIEELIKLFS